MNRRDYLSRIGLDPAGISVDPDSLARLQQQHLLTVPFENLDIHWGRPIVLDTRRFYEKIVRERRGGFCYELNGLFNELLRDIGFETRLISARVFSGEKGYGPEFDHAAMIVNIDGDEYLTDVGFGDFSAAPLPFVLDKETADAAGTFIIRRSVDDHLEVTKRDSDGWSSQYIFKDAPHDLSEFSEMCDYQQYSPESHFTKGKVCSLMTKGGRKSLTGAAFKVTTNGEKVETQVASEQEFDRILLTEFGIRRPA